MADLSKITTLVNGDVFDPQVVSDMINAKVEKKAVMSGYIKVDNTLSGQAGSTVTVPKWGYIGEAKDLQEGEKIDSTKMAFTTSQYGVKKIGKGVMLTEHNLISVVYYGLQVADIGDKCLSVLPYHHTYEAVAGILVELHKHSTICINDSLKNVLKNFLEQMRFRKSI